jgi:alpha,alpha-trehalose phosphorylase
MNSQYSAALFDLDGVITSTTHQHFQAWQIKIKEHFNIDVDPSLETLTRGVSRIESLRILLNAYDVNADEAILQKVAFEKNELYQELIKDFDQKDCLEGVIALLNLLKEQGFKIALCSASKNGPSLLKALKIEHYFDVIVDPSKGPGKPNPYIFLEAAKLLGVEPQVCLGFEDAISGVSAIIDAGMFAIGVGHEPLQHANIHVTSLTYINEDFINSLNEIDHGLDPQVLIHEDKISLDELKVDETLFSLSNGIIGFKGSFSEGYGHHDDVPQTFINGFYNTIPYHYEENSIHFPQVGQTMINVLDGSVMHIYINDKQVDMTHSILKSLKRKYYLHEGRTWREAIYETNDNHLITVCEERLVSTKFQNLIITNMTIESNYPNDLLTVVSKIRLPQVKDSTSLDPRIAKSLKHLNYDSAMIKEHKGYLRANTNASNLSCEIGMTHSIQGELFIQNEEVLERFEVDLNQPFTITKYCALKGSHLNDDICTQSLLSDVQPYSYYQTLQRCHYQKFVNQHRLTTSSQAMNLALHFNLTHLYGSGGVDSKIQIGAKGISGEGYEGHYFWDTEIYMLPFFAFTHPERAKNLLAFRYHTLDDAKQEARKLGVNRGAKIPWRTINGKEASPYYPAGSAQVHINSDIAYAINQIYVLTHDEHFMRTIGFELMLETAIFLLDYGHFNDTGFHLDGVTGPDEYTAIVNDNAYTNMMAKFHFERVVLLSQQDIYQEIIQRCGYSHKDIEALNEAAVKMVIHFDEKRQIIAQDSTFLSKKVLDVNSIPLDKKPMLLHYHPLYIYKHQVLKQADTVLGCVLLPLKDQLVFGNTLHYYLNITTHDSSLSKAMYGIAAYRLNDSTLGKSAFDDILKIDLHNARKHTQHGLHMANIGGSYLLVLYGLFGCVVNEDVSFNPRPLTSFDFVSTRIQIQGVAVDLRLERDIFSLKSEAMISCRVGQDMVTLIPNQWTMYKVI